jgi:hypothetical protein
VTPCEPVEDVGWVSDSVCARVHKKRRDHWTIKRKGRDHLSLNNFYNEFLNKYKKLKNKKIINIFFYDGDSNNNN